MYEINMNDNSSGDPIYLAFEGRLESIYEDILASNPEFKHEVVVPQGSQLMFELSKKWREYITGLGQGIKFSTSYKSSKEKLTIPNPLYSDEFKFIEMDEETSKKIEVLGLP